jgi:hypothetical protein
MLLACDGKLATVNAALRQAAFMSEHYKGDTPFASLVGDLALSLLRYGWHPDADDDTCYAAEVNASVEPRTGIAE